MATRACATAYQTAFNVGSDVILLQMDDAFTLLPCNSAPRSDPVMTNRLNALRRRSRSDPGPINRLALDMDRSAVSRQHPFMHRFAQRWVREDRIHQVLLGRFELLRDDETLNQLRHFGALPYSASLAGAIATTPTRGIEARPQMTSTLFFLRRPATPALS